jgi:hypothetical protein
MKRYSGGWFRESYRHSLAAKGIRTSMAAKKESLIDFGDLIKWSGVFLTGSVDDVAMIDKDLPKNGTGINLAAKKDASDKGEIVPDDLRWAYMHKEILGKTAPVVMERLKSGSVPTSELYDDIDVVNMIKQEARIKERGIRERHKQEAELGMRPDEDTHGDGPPVRRRRHFSGKNIWERKYPDLVKPFPGENPRIEGKFARFRQEDPSRFQQGTFRTKKLSGDTSIILGKLKGKHKMSIQSVLKKVK